MELFYDDIFVKKETVIKSGVLRIKKNTINLIQGENGSGKTLLIKNISRNSRNTSHNIVLVDQDNSVTLSNCSVMESITIDDDDEKNRIISKTITDWSFSGLFELKNGKMSGGEQRLTNILRGLVSDASIIMLDEPTNDLDYETVDKLLAILNDVKKEKTLIIISHDDRLMKIADNTFLVLNKELIQTLSNRTSFFDIADDHEEKHERNQDYKRVKSTILKKSISYNYVNIVSFIVLAIVIFLQASEFKILVNNYDEKVCLPDNEIILCNFFTNEVSLNYNAIPLKAYSSLSTMNIVKNLNVIQEIKELFNRYNAEAYNVYIESTDKYMTYPLEYYNMNNDELINVIEYYKAKYYPSAKNDMKIDTTDYFYETNGSIGSKYDHKLNIDQYTECVDELNKNKELIISAVAVVFYDGSNPDDFFISETAEDLGRHMVLAHSEQIKEHLFNLRVCTEGIRSLVIIIFAIILLLFINWGSMRLLMFSYKNAIYLFRNYNYDPVTLKNDIIYRINNRIPLLILFGLFLFILSIYFKDLRNLQVKYIFHFGAIIYCSMAYNLGNWEIIRHIKKYYRWNSR